MLLGIAVLGAGCTEDEAELAQKRCSALRDHLIDLRLQAANDLVDVKAHRKALQQALGADFVVHCRERPLEEIRCALSAKDTSSVAECSPSSLPK